MIERIHALSGGCMCGAVRFELTRPPAWMYHCHCSTCRRASGASCATNVVASFDALAITQGAECIDAYESSPGKRRYFCSRCGSPLYSRGAAAPDVISVRAGTLHDSPGLQPAYHAYAAEAAPWSGFGDGLPRFEGAPDRAYLEQLLVRLRGT
jgi:hypothetical protein